MIVHEPPLFLRDSTLVFEDIPLVDIERVPGLYPTAQGRLVRLLDELNERWNNPRYLSRYSYDDDE